METDVEQGDGNMITLPENRLIRRRVAARTTAIHASAIADEPWAKEMLQHCDGDGYLQKHQFPVQIALEESPGEPRVISRDEAWRLADEKGEALEGELLSGLPGRIAAFFSTHGQGIYANYGRPTMDFSGFFSDHLAGARSGTVQIGPLFIAFDTASAAGLTALGHIARGANLTNAAVASDILSTGAYEGTSAWTSAKIGVIAGAKAMGITAVLPLAGAPVAALVAGFAVGAATAIVVKRTTNQLKDKVVDAAYEAAADRRAVLEPMQAPV
jgi:hypothetical protein